MVLKLTCKMSGFRSGKVRSGEQRERHRGRRTSSVPGGSCQGGKRSAGKPIQDAHLPVLVSTMMALAQHLKEASTAPMAMVSVGSRVR